MRQIDLKKNLPLALLLVLLIDLILCPLVTVFAKAVIVDGRLDLYQAWQTIASSENVQTVCNSLLLGVCVVLCSTVIAVPTAYFLARTQLAKHGWLDIIFMIPFMTPPYIASMGWILFMQKKGLFQQLFPATGSWSEGFFCFGGLVLVMSLHVFPFLMTMLKNAMLNIPASLEESGAVFGAGFGLRLRKIFAPLLTGNYAIGALLVFVKTLSEYGTPYTLGRRIGFYVFTTDIHRYSTTAPIDFGRSASLSSILVCICMAMWLMQNYITNKNSYRLVSGKGSRPARTKLSIVGQLGAWLWVALVVLIAIGVPYFSIISTSLIKLRGYGLAAGNFTLAHYKELLSTPKALSSIWKSLFLAVSSATICSVIGTAVVAAVRKSKGFFKKALEGISLLPEMLPSIVLVIGIMLFWNAIYKALPLYNTIGIMVLAYVVLYLPYTVQYVTSSFTQINGSLLEAGRTFGGTPAYVFRRITLLFLLFEAVAITLWLTKDNLFYLLNFSYIGGCLALGTALFTAGKRYARHFVQLAVGCYMLLYLGVISRENMQIEGFWYYLFLGSFEAAIIHYAVAKIFGPLLFGHGWCGYACWTAMVLDFLPYK